MQLPTHLIIGIAIQILILEYFMIPDIFSIVIISLLAFTSHFITDAVAKATYHPPQRVYDSFWLFWHVFVYCVGIFLVIMFIRRYWLAMLFANLPDLWDWYIIRNIALLKNDPDWGKKYYLHQLVDNIRSKFFVWLPDLSYNRYGIIPELIIIFLWIIFVIFNHVKIL